MSELPARLQEIVEDFSYCEGQEKLEYLLEFAERLPDLPERIQEQHDQMEQVHECITPIFVTAERENGRIIYHFDVPREAPTARGYAEMLRQGLAEASKEEILAVPNEFYLQTGLQHVLTGQRLNGITAILTYMKQLAQDI